MLLNRSNGKIVILAKCQRSNVRSYWYVLRFTLHIQFERSFQVPLNYSEPLSSSDSASIALIHILSPYPPSSENYKGPLLFNPGGPGRSGVDFVLAEGQLLRTLAGDAFDIVSFDPRGTC
jgi:hypothetical protein